MGKWNVCLHTDLVASMAHLLRHDRCFIDKFASILSLICIWPPLLIILETSFVILCLNLLLVYTHGVGIS
jgi:hypothetical protein